MRHRLFALALAVGACSGSSGHGARYPRRPPGCELALYHNLPAGAWDDIGPVEVDCYLDESEIACLGRLRTEACRMGGDIVYDVPSKALRPYERGMIYRAKVGHTRVTKKPDDGPAPDAGSGPIEPLPNAARAPVPAPAPKSADGGATAPDGGSH
jgi:hypothetical protein